jgi:hypothetical protein
MGGSLPPLPVVEPPMPRASGSNASPVAQALQSTGAKVSHSQPNRLR